MIDYYRQNYKPNITLPSNWNEDVSSQIFKNYPFYPAISKSTYRPELYYDQNCQLDITFKEFIDYVVEEEPANYAIMILQEYDTNVSSRLAYVNKNDDNTYTYKDFYIDDEGVNVGDDYVESTQKILNLIIAEFNGSGGNQIWYDLSTVYNIYSRRTQCQEFNKSYHDYMTSNYVKQFLSGIPKITDKNTFIMYYSYFLYLLYIILINHDNTDTNAVNAIIDYINDFIALLNDGIPDNVNEMNTLLEDYIIQDILSINKKTSTVSITLTV